ncbi:hypothetical protein HZY86_01555 [Aerococcaceae bacterium DSM 111020]|nr:hypothetical protein [Aerococcaceae bacterium DSM 111020]
MSPFIWPEILLFALPVIGALYSVLILKPHIADYPISIATYLLPMWLIVIHALSVLMYNFSVLPLLLLVSFFVLALVLHDYIRQIERFYAMDFLKIALRSLFMMWTIFLFAMLIARIVSYFLV